MSKQETKWDLKKEKRGRNKIWRKNRRNGGRVAEESNAGKEVEG